MQKIKEFINNFSREDFTSKVKIIENKTVFKTQIEDSVNSYSIQFFRKILELR